MVFQYFADASVLNNALLTGSVDIITSIQSGNVGPRSEAFNQKAAFRLLADMMVERGPAQPASALPLSPCPQPILQV
ncbi:hypothetical protein [Ochrobactrum sp. CGA5]|uniref:hypothetical protein n=1 Tax=Ochrobactrum sp. CGA5 TaxID=2583453 RepID=UPI001FFF53EA|nr:hypothetical protein [Ochrobactrum sp. CGA5]